jgi:group II intron reverse transcriptase/maturase
MKTSLQAIANRAKKSKKYRFGNLYTMLNQMNLEDSWKYMNRQAASGVDKQTAKIYEQYLHANVTRIVKNLKRKQYKANLVKRVYIPKGKGKKRPLGLPAVDDKLIQTASARILNSIYEQDFLPYSFGYRTGTGPQQAVKTLTETLRFGNFHFIVEADIKGFFDNINHEWLIRMLEQRINDRAFIKLVKKWLKAGILETKGEIVYPVTGTPQGGVISPVLANIYLHYVLDIWFEKVIKPKCEGDAYICRFADDYVCAFQYESDAEKFYKILPKRLGKFNLKIASEKTRIIKYSQSNVGETSFEFLGFEFRWAKSRKGKNFVKRRTSRKKFRQSLHNLTEWCHKNNNLKLREFFKLMNSKLRGYYNYYGVIGNYASLDEFKYQAERIIFKVLNRRSQKKSFNWAGFREILKYHRLEKARITERRTYQFSLFY